MPGGQAHMTPVLGTFAEAFRGPQGRGYLQVTWTTRSVCESANRIVPGG